MELCPLLHLIGWLVTNSHLKATLPVVCYHPNARSLSQPISHSMAAQNAQAVYSLEKKTLPPTIPFLRSLDPSLIELQLYKCQTTPQLEQ